MRILLTFVALAIGLLLNSCASNHPPARPSSPLPLKPRQARATVTELPVDWRLASALGVTVRTVEISYPSSRKLSVITRVYTNGVLDVTASSRQVHGTSMAKGNQVLSLGWLDPDVSSPQPQSMVKVFGTAGTFWIRKTSETGFGAFVDVPKTGKVPMEKEQLVMELALGNGSPKSSSGVGTSDIREGAAIRITLHGLLEPLTKEEQDQLQKYSNFNKAFQIDE